MTETAFKMNELEKEQDLVIPEVPFVVPVNVENAEKKLTDKEIDDIVDLAKERMDDVKRVFDIRVKMGIDPYSTKENITGMSLDNFSETLMSRMKNDSLRQKFIASKIDILKSDAPYDNGSKLSFVKDYRTKKYHYDQIRNYDENLNSAFSHTTYVPSIEHSKGSNELGDDRENGTVFVDAKNAEGVELTSLQKSIIEAHEKGHVIRSFKANTEDFYKGFDFSKLPENLKRPTYLKHPDELAERMSQLKNYFGFKGDDLFSREHLLYARENYIRDTELDNNMSEFFSIITKETEDEFLRIINQYPI